MGFWNTAKWAMTSALDHVEGRPPEKNYKLHPYSAYLGNKYYPKETSILPISTRSSKTTSHNSSSPPGSIPSSVSPPQIDPGSHTNIMQPHVHIGRKAMRMPMRLLAEKYTVLRQEDLVDDDKIDRTVGRNKDLYWVIKGAVVLMVRERSDAESKTPVRERNRTGAGRDAKDRSGEAMRNPLRSPSVEGTFSPSVHTPPCNSFTHDSPDFLADVFDADQFTPIDVLPPNPLNIHAASRPLNPLDAIPWSELVVVFRRDTKELFVRKGDGKLYPVVWKVRKNKARLKKKKADEGARGARKVRFTSVEGEIDADDYVNVESV